MIRVIVSSYPLLLLNAFSETAFLCVAHETDLSVLDNGTRARLFALFANRICSCDKFLEVRNSLCLDILCHRQRAVLDKSQIHYACNEALRARYSFACVVTAVKGSITFANLVGLALESWDGREFANGSHLIVCFKPFLFSTF